MQKKRAQGKIHPMLVLNEYLYIFFAFRRKVINIFYIPLYSLNKRQKPKE